MFNAAREKSRLWLLLLVGVVATLLGQTHAQQIFEQLQPASGKIALTTPATTGDFYDADRYDAPDSRLAAKSASVVSRSGTFPRDVSWFNEAAVLEDMALSPIGRQVLGAAQSNQFRLEFSASYFRQSYGAAADTSVMGMAFRNKAKVYLPAVGSNAGAASTAIHEGVHMLGVAGSRRAEALARLAEVMHGGGTINRGSIRGVLQEMDATGAYNHMHWRSGGSTPNFPGLGF